MLDHFYPHERVAVFIDGMNLYGSLRALGYEIDFRKLHQIFAERTRLLRKYYYTTLPENEGQAVSVRPLIDWLQYNGYSITTRVLREYSDEFDRRKIRGGIEVDLVVSAMEMAPHLDHIVLMSGDGSYSVLIRALQRRGLRTTVISTDQTQPKMIADELKRQADFFVDLEDMRSLVARPGPSGGHATPSNHQRGGPHRGGYEEEGGDNQYVEGIDPPPRTAPPRGRGAPSQTSHSRRTASFSPKRGPAE